MIITAFINPIKIVVLLTALHAWLKLPRIGKVSLLLHAILALCLATEIVNLILDMKGISAKTTTTISVIFHDILWLFLLKEITGRHKLCIVAIAVFGTFALTNLLFIEGFDKFNFNTFILGAILYVLIFMYHSSIKLRTEDFEFFTNQNFLIVFAPLIFFVGLSMLFAFRSTELHFTEIAGFTMWTWIINFVNLIYYSVLNIYIYRQSRLAYDL